MILFSYSSPKPVLLVEQMPGMVTKFRDELLSKLQP